jgi:protein SCO1/2
MRRALTVATLAGAAVLVVLGAGVVLQTPPPADAPQVGGPFTLTDGAGHQVTQASYDGFWRLVYFGYTHCPDACPTTLSKLGAALDKLSPGERAQIRVLFVSVDPARDTPAVIGDYARAFGPEFVGLTGTPAQLGPVLNSFHVYAKRHDLVDGDYAMDHSSIVYVMNKQGRSVGLLDDGLSPEAMAQRLRGWGA